MDVEVRTTGFVLPGFSSTFHLMLPFVQRPVLIFAQLIEKCSVLFMAGAGMRRPLGYLFFFFSLLIELEDSGAPAAPVLR